MAKRIRGELVWDDGDLKIVRVPEEEAYGMPFWDKGFWPSGWYILRPDRYYDGPDATVIFDGETYRARQLLGSLDRCLRIINDRDGREIWLDEPEEGTAYVVLRSTP